MQSLDQFCLQCILTALKPRASQVLTLDSWADGIARHVITNQPGMVIFFLLFLMVTSYGLLNLVVGVIVENTLATARDEPMFTFIILTVQYAKLYCRVSEFHMTKKHT